MKRLIATVVPALAITAAAASGPPASSAQGSGALAFAVLVGIDSPLLDGATRTNLIKLIEDKPLPPGQQGKISVTATSVVCREGDVNLAAYGCTLTFGTKTVTFVGRRANELYATMVESGVASDGAAGTIYEAVHTLTCSLDPKVLASKDGGGAACNYSPGPS
jgi:hypothetical protein